MNQKIKIERKQDNKVVEQLKLRKDDKLGQLQNINLVGPEEMSEIYDSLRRLNTKKEQQLALVSQKYRQHHHCLIEIVKNLQELEDITGMKVDMRLTRLLT